MRGCPLASPAAGRARRDIPAVLTITSGAGAVFPVTCGVCPSSPFPAECRAGERECRPSGGAE